MITVFQRLAFGAPTTGALPGPSANDVTRGELRAIHDAAIADVPDDVETESRFVEGAADDMLVEQSKEVDLLGELPDPRHAARHRPRSGGVAIRARVIPPSAGCVAATPRSDRHHTDDRSKRDAHAEVDDLGEHELGTDEIRIRARPKGYVLLGDRGSGLAMAVTYWESEEDLQASEDAVTPERERAAQTASAASGPVVERYEVVASS